MPVTVVDADVGLVIVGVFGPLTKFQVLVSAPVAALPVMEKLVTPDARHCGTPAMACLGPALLLVVMFTVEKEVPQELAIVQVNE